MTTIDEWSPVSGKFTVVMLGTVVAGATVVVGDVVVAGATVEGVSALLGSVGVAAGATGVLVIAFDAPESPLRIGTRDVGDHARTRVVHQERNERR